MEEVRVTIGRLSDGETSVMISASVGGIGGPRISVWMGASSGRRSGEIISLGYKNFATFVELLTKAKVTLDQLVEMANRDKPPPVPGTKLSR